MDSDDILVICPSLVTITGGRNVFIVEPHILPDGTSIPGIKLTESSNEPKLLLARFSVKEFLVSEKIKTSGLPGYYLSSAASHASIAKTCLVYLLHCCNNENEVLAPNLCPLIEYAAQEWLAHYRAIGDQASTEEVDKLGLKMMATSTRHFGTWRNFYYRTDSAKTSLDTPLGCMIWLEIFGVVQLMLDEGIDPDTETESGQVPLTIAARLKSSSALPMINLLLESGADINRCSDIDGTVLQRGILERDGALFHFLLLEKHADPNIDHPICGTVLSIAIEVYKNDYALCSRFVDELLDHGADVNAGVGAKRSPLKTAIRSCLGPMVIHLLEKGADFNADTD